MTATATIEQIEAVVDGIAKPIYVHFGSWDSIRAFIIEALTDSELVDWYGEEENEPSIAALRVRNVLFGYVNVRHTAAATATKIFVALGRANEVGYLPIEGKM